MSMKKTVKIALWTVGSLVIFIVAAVAVAVNIVFTPSRLTPIVREQLPHYVTCQADVEQVELTFFSTFPHFSLRLQGVTLVNPKEGAPSDTLLSLTSLDATLDVMAYLRENRVDLQSFVLRQGDANLYVASDSTTNFDIMVPSDSDEPSTPLTESALYGEMSLQGIALDHLNLTYRDEVMGCAATVRDLQVSLHATSLLRQVKAVLDIEAAFDEVSYRDATGLNFLAQGLRLAPLQARIDEEERGVASLCCTADSLRAEVPAAQLEFSSLRLDVADLVVNRGGSVIDTRLDMQSAAAWVNVPEQGCMLNRLPLALAGQLNMHLADVRTIRFADGQFHVADEALALAATMEWPDSTLAHLTADVTLQPTTMKRLLALVPAPYRKALAGMTIEGEMSQLKAHGSVLLPAEGRPDLQAFEVATTLRRLHYGQKGQMDAMLDAFDLQAAYPVQNARMEALKQEQQARRQQATRGSRRSRAVRDAHFMQATVAARGAHFVMSDPKTVDATIPTLAFSGSFSDEILDDAQSLPFIAADFDFDQLTGTLDTLALTSHGLQGSFMMADGVRGMKKYYEAMVEAGDIDLNVGSTMQATTGAVQVEASAVYDHAQQDLLLRYNPVLNVTMEDADLQMADVPYPFQLPLVDFDFNLGRFDIRSGKLRYGNSDFTLSGEVTNLREYLKKESLLNARLDLTSNQTDVYQLRDLVDGFGTQPATVSAQAEGVTTPEVAAEESAADYITHTLESHQSQPVDTVGGRPFMVPEGIDLTLNTHIARAVVGDNLFTNLGGGVTIRDGVLVLEEMGFSSRAARMQLTAIYRSPRKDNLFVGANFHLLDIQIDELLRLIPEIDTIAPMLRSFEGQAEFHLAAETNLRANYDVKMSTLKAVASIEGKDLVLLDGPTFSTIAKYLMFDKQTRNRVDTLSVEMAVNRQSMTLYPMLIGMDRYQAVVSGNHRLSGDMPFNYHISVTKAPLVGGLLGLDVMGDMQAPEDFKFKLVGCRYAHLYKPERRNLTQQQTLELKTLISTALKRTVKE